MGNICVAIGTAPRNHRYTVTIDTQALLYVTHHLQYAGSSHNFLSPHKCSVSNIQFHYSKQLMVGGVGVGALPEPEAGPKSCEVTAVGFSRGRLA